MRITKIFSKLSNNTEQSAKNNVRRFFVTKPDTLDITRKPKLSKWGKLKKNFKENFTGLTKQTVRELDRCSMEDFFEKSKKLIIDSYHIPESLAAPIKRLQGINKKIGMMYDFFENTIYVNPIILKKPRYSIFSFIKHEYTHQKQNYQILMTEGVGEKAIEEYARIHTKISIDSFVNQYSQMTDKEIMALQPEIMAFMPWIMGLRNAVKNGPEAVNEFKKSLFNRDYPIHLNTLNELRQKVIKECGIIPAGTKEAKISQLYFNGFLNLYKDPLDFKANWKALNEQEAYNKQGYAVWEYLFHKIF